MIPIQPLEIQVNKKAGSLIIEWSDLHHTEIPFSLWRAACPCAQCRGGHENMRSTPDTAIFTSPQPTGNAIVIIDVNLTGSYAINPVWADGHHFGIYHWTYLRALCPCIECRNSH